MHWLGAATADGFTARFCIGAASRRRHEPGWSFESNGKYYICVNGNDSKERCRYTACHELAHIVLGLPSDHKELPWWSYAKRSPNEIFCDVFAAELLLPYKLFKPLIEKTDISLSVVDDLAERFVASNMATGSRFAALVSAPCVFVLSEQGKVRYASRSTMQKRTFVTVWAKSSPIMVLPTQTHGPWHFVQANTQEVWHMTDAAIGVTRTESDEIELFFHAQQAKPKVLSASLHHTLREVLLGVEIIRDGQARQGGLRAMLVTGEEIFVFVGECEEALSEPDDLEDGADDHAPVDIDLTLEVLEIHPVRATVRGRAIPCLDCAQQRHEIIANRVALAAEGSVSGVTGATAQVNQETPQCAFTSSPMTESPSAASLQPP
jgi:hypothetical protein